MYMEGPECCCHPCCARAWGHTTRDQDDGASPGSRLLWGAHSPSELPDQGQAGEGARKVASAAPHATALPPASWHGTHQTQRLQLAATFTATSPSAAARHGCEGGFQQVPMGKRAARCMVWLLRGAEEPGCCAVAPHGTQSTAPSTSSTPQQLTQLTPGLQTGHLVPHGQQ